jgi:hypothetical protein
MRRAIGTSVAFEHRDYKRVEAVDDMALYLAGTLQWLGPNWRNVSGFASNECSSAPSLLVLLGPRTALLHTIPALPLHREF